MRVGLLSGCLALLLSSLALGAGEGSSPTSSPEQLVFVPYEKMTGPQLGPQQSVLVPYAEFLRLKKAGEPPEEAAFTPVASLSQAQYTGRVEGEVAVFDAQFTLEVMARPKDTLEVQLPFSGASLERATLEGAGGGLVSPLENAAGVRVKVKGQGQRVLHLGLAVPLRLEGALKRLEFGVPRAAAAQLKLHTAEEAVLEPGGEALPATVEISAQGGGTTITASAGSSEKIRLLWRPRVQQTATAAEARLAVQEDLKVNLGAAAASAEARLKFSFLTGSTNSLFLRVPREVQLLGVSGAFLKDWSAPDADRLVSVTLVREIAEPFELLVSVKLDAQSSATKLSVPEFRVPAAVRETGTVSVLPDEAVSVWPEEVAGVESVSAPSETPRARVFRFNQPGWKLLLSRRAVQPRLRAEGVLLYEVTDEAVRLKTRHHVTVSGRGVFDLSFEVPEGYELRDAGPAELVSGFRQQGRRVEVNLKGEQRAALDVELRLQRSRASGEAKLALEPVALVGAEEDTGNVVLAAPLALRATEADSSGLQATDVRALEGQLRPLLSQDLVAVLGYRYFTPSFHAAALVERQRTRLTCETSLLASVQPSLLRIDAALNYQVEFSATDEFQLLVPASAGEDVRFTGADIKEKIPAKLDRVSSGSGELTTWTIRLQRRVLGPYRLELSFDMPLPQTELEKPMKITLPTVRALNVARETGFVAVSRGENVEVRVARSEGLEPRDTRELPPALASAFLGFRYFEPEKQSLELELVRHEPGAVLGALVRRMHIDTVLNDQREAVHEALFEVQNNREQYLILKLPQKMEIWSAFVRGTPVRPTLRESDGARLIELTKSQSKDDAFRVRLVLREKLSGGDMGSFGRLSFASPEIENMPVVRVTRKLYLPRAYRYVEFGGTMQLERGGTRPWLEPAADKLLDDLPTEAAGGVAQRVANPPDVQVSAQYDVTESEPEKKARLQGSALEIPIVREGLQFEFSKLSGVGSIEVEYLRTRLLLGMQVGVALVVLLVLGFLARSGRGAWLVALVTLLLFIAASLTEGLAARLVAPALAASVVALLFGVVLLVMRKNREAAAAHQASMEALRQSSHDQSPTPPPIPPSSPDAPEPGQEG